MGADGGQERVGLADLTVGAIFRRVGVEDVSAHGRDVGSEILAAGLTGLGGVEVEVFIRGADDAGVGDGRGQHPVDDVRERREAIHENPESRHVIR